MTVSDTGCGISEEFLQRHLFSPFRSTKKGGWGIGLYHSKQVVEHHDGTIVVKSVEGQGTMFAVTLPLWGGPAPTTRDIDYATHTGETAR